VAEATEQLEMPSPLPDVLLADDDPLILETLSFVLRDAFSVHTVETRRSALELVRMRPAPMPLALVDLGLPPDPHEPDEGFALISQLLAVNPMMKVIVLSGQNQRANIQHALTLGAVDFVAKPCEPALLRARLDHHLMILDAELGSRSDAVRNTEFIGTSAVVEKLREQVQKFANTPFPVLIQGESGTGKELVAKALHDQSNRADAPFLTVNCAAFTPELLEAQLFGHAKGAFTGASDARAGFFEDAGNGTLFLDEIGEFPVSLQPKLLRVLENGEFYRIGETRARMAEPRIIAATNRDLMDEIRTGNFRHDLYHRLSVLTLDLPPLRDRDDDALLLLEHFRQTYADRMAPFSLDAAAEERWRGYSFPGNVRELRNIVIRLGAKFPGERVGLTELEAELDSQSEVDADTMASIRGGEFSLDQILDDWEQRYIDAALKLSDGNLSEAARLLGVNRTTLYSKIQRLSGQRPPYKSASEDAFAEVSSAAS